MFARIRMFVGNFFRRFRRPALPVLVHTFEYNGPAGDKHHRHARAPHNAGTRFTGIDPAEAAADIFAPSHGEEDTFRFSRVSPDGTVPHLGQLWHRQNNSMRVHRRRTMLTTGSGGVVSTPEEIKGICSECGEPEAEPLIRCARCGVVVCQLHGLVIPHDPHIYCRTHAAEAIEGSDTWTAYDIQHGLQPEQSVQPARPWAVAKYSQCGGPNRV